MGNIIYISLAILVAATSSAFAKPVIGPPFRNLQHPIVDAVPLSMLHAPYPARNDIFAVFRQQSSIKDQGERGTCSIFSVTAQYETLLIMNGLATPDIDLSEEWLQYLTTQHTGKEGSEAPDNFRLLRTWGQPPEAALPYGKEPWKTKTKGLAAKRCGHLPRSWQLRSCLTSHRDPALLSLTDQQLLDPDSVNYDPEFLQARRLANVNREAFLLNTGGDGVVTRVSEVQKLLMAGIPLVLDIDFWNGAWNFTDGRKWGIQASPKLWAQGTVTYPEKGSIDRAHRDKGGHSVLVVGFDVDREVSYWVNMRDGSRKKFTRRGVYYFKNSWGDNDWGRDFSIDGIKFPGYGMILMDNAHEFGQFFRMVL